MATKTIAALYDHMADASKAVRDLVDTTYFSNEDINIISQDADNRHSRHLNDDHDDDTVTATEAGAGAGATAGTVIGALVGLLVGTSTIVLPGVGAILALGPIGATLAGAGVGAAIGGLTGALVGYGIDESDAKLYTEAVRRGGSLLLLRADEDKLNVATEILERHNPVDIERRSEHWESKGWSGHDEKAPAYTHDQIKKEYSSYPEDVRTGRDGYRVGLYENAPSTTRSASSGSHFSFDDDDLRKDFSSHYESNPPSRTDINRKTYLSAYDFGAGMGRSEKYRDMKWEQAQADAHKIWAEQHDARDEHWEELKDRVQYAWHKSKAKYHEKSS